MKHLGLVLASLVGGLLLSSCGGPDAGDTCEGSNYVCKSDAEALECRGGTWRALQCRGPLGCRELEDSVRCDTSTNIAGDNCAVSAEGRGICRADGKSVLECREGVLVQTATCSSCTQSGAQLVCQP